jgi:hypothetical protein
MANHVIVECPVCYDLKPCEFTICDHNICHECIENWYNFSDRCPICRTLLFKNENIVKMKIHRHRYQHRHQDSSINNENVNCVTGSSQILSNDPDDVVRMFNTMSNDIPTSQCTEDNRIIYFIFYINDKPSKNWYLNDFSPYIKERLMLRTNTHMILNELELIFSELSIL